MEAIEFSNVSIRGRMAFAIGCLENVLNHFDLRQPIWQTIINKFWKLTSAQYLDEWHYEMLECYSDSILEDLSYKTKEFECLTEKEYDEILSLYKVMHPVILELIDRMIDMGSFIYYEEKISKDKQWFYPLQTIINILTSNNIGIPKTDSFTKFEFDYGYGWGRKFDRDLKFIE